MRPPQAYSVLARRMGPGGAGATSLGVRARERESLIVLAPLARTPSVSPRRTLGIGDGARVVRNFVLRRTRRTSAPRTNAHPMPPICDE